MKECVSKATGQRFAVKCINKSALNPKDRSNLVQEINILKEVPTAETIALSVSMIER